MQKSKLIKCKSKNKKRGVYPCLTKSVKLTLILAQLSKSKNKKGV